MKKIVIALAFGLVLISAAAAYRYIPAVKKMFVSEHPDIPAFIDEQMNIKDDLTKLKSLSEAGFTSVDSKLKIVEYKKRYDSLYAGHKFISDGVLGELLKKFNLAYSRVSDYVGEVPDVNLSEINRFRIKHPFEVKDQRVDGMFLLGDFEVWRDENGHFYRKVDNEFLIVAPSTGFTRTIGGYTVDGKQIVKDPIVLYKVEGGHIIVTSW